MLGLYPPKQHKGKDGIKNKFIIHLNLACYLKPPPLHPPPPPMQVKLVHASAVKPQYNEQTS